MLLVYVIISSISEEKEPDIRACAVLLPSTVDVKRMWLPE